jgi:serine/threonine-protein kinase
MDGERELDPRMDPSGIPPPGSVIAGRYRITQVIASGGMGTILAATHEQLGQRVAIKMLLPEVAEKPEFVERFLREARAAVSLEGQHVVRVYDVGTLDSGLPYMVMEHLRGHDLARELEQRGMLPMGEAVDYLLQACEAVAEAHQIGIVHRDLKPANLFLASQPDGSRCLKVLDFGISKRVGAAPSSTTHGLTVASALLGSPQYMSPEQIRNARTVDFRTDIWALGIVLYELLSNSTPFPGDTIPSVSAMIVADFPVLLSSIRPGLSRGLEAAVYKCLEKDPARRFQNVADLVEALSPFSPDSARPTIERIRKIARKAVVAEPETPGRKVAVSSGAPTLAVPGAQAQPRESSASDRSRRVRVRHEGNETLVVGSTDLDDRVIRRRVYVGAVALLMIALVVFTALRIQKNAAEEAQVGAPPETVVAPSPAPTIEGAKLAAEPSGSPSPPAAASSVVAEPALVPVLSRPHAPRRHVGNPALSGSQVSAKAAAGAPQAPSPSPVTTTPHDTLDERK